LYFAVYYIIIIFYPRQSLFSAHTHTTHNNVTVAYYWVLKLAPTVDARPERVGEREVMVHWLD